MARFWNPIPDLKATLEEEEKHEQELLGMIEEERLDYVGSMVLGLNDALVELTGALAGLTFAFRNTQLIALSGLITGIAASLSMASSEYLSHRADQQGSRAVKAALYTGIAYIITVTLLVLPYLLLQSYVWALAATMGMAILIILVFNFYVSVAKDVSFKKHFLEMAGLSLGSGRPVLRYWNTGEKISGCGNLAGNTDVAYHMFQGYLRRPGSPCRR